MTAPIQQVAFGDLDNEFNNTRKVLERVPADKLSWRPHAKSMSLGELALHVAGLPWFFEVGVRQNGYDMANWKKSADPTATAEIVKKFDETSAEARKALAEVKAETLGDTWSLSAGDQVFLSVPRAVVLRTFAISHIIHHRAQLIVYLRMLDVPVPGLYGPSADEQ
jgi:uncharacterized damage-inducible protein DinB